MDFLATQYGAIWTWIHSLVPVAWLSFVLVVVVLKLPLELWTALGARTKLREKRYLLYWKEQYERIKAAAAGSERYPVWQGQQSAKLMTIFDPVSKGSCLSLILSWFIVGFKIVLFFAVWAVLLDPLQGIDPGTSLWSAICGDWAQSDSCRPSDIGIFGFDFRIAPVDGINILGWALFGIWFIFPLRKWRPVNDIAEVDVKKIQWKVWAFFIVFAVTMLFLPAGLVVIGLVGRILHVPVSLFMKLQERWRATTWESRIDAELEFLTPPDRFFVPELRGEGSNPESRTRAVIAELLTQAKQVIEEQCSEGDVQLTERISLVGSVPRFGDIRMVIKPEPEGNVIAFLGENVDIVAVVEDIVADMWGCEVDALPVPIAQVTMSELLLDGRRVSGEE